MSTDKKFRIAIPKGSLMEGSRDLFAKANINFELSERKLVYETDAEQVEMMIVRPKDVAVYVENGGADLGIVGSDVLEEHSPHVITLLSLAFGHCSLVVAAPKNGPYQKLSHIPDFCRVATKFPSLARSFFRSQGIPVEIIELYGSIEIAPLTGLSEVIVDLVGSGRTLRENGLVSIETISNHSARLIANRVSWQLHHPWILEILGRIREEQLKASNTQDSSTCSLP